MLSSPKQPTFQDLPIKKKLDTSQLQHITIQLELIFLALESLVEITPDTISSIGKKLKINSQLLDKINPWGNQKLELDEAKSLVLIICYLAHENQELIRRGVTLLEESLTKSQSLYQVSLLRDYIEKFINSYQKLMGTNEDISTEKVEQLAIKLLIDLLFYSDKNGHLRLWLMLLDFGK